MQGDSVMLQVGVFAAPDKVFPGLGFHHHWADKENRWTHFKFYAEDFFLTEEKWTGLGSLW